MLRRNNTLLVTGDARCSGDWRCHSFPSGCLIHPASALLLAYPLQVARLGLRQAISGQPAPFARAFFLVLGRLPDALGVASYWWRRWRRSPVRLIEYK